MQPERDYRGRVVRKKQLDESATRVGTFEKVLVAGAFVLILVAIGVIVKLGMDGAPKGGPKEEDLGGEVAAQTEAPEAEAAPVQEPEEADAGEASAAEEPATDAAAPEAAPAPEVAPTPAPEPREAPEPPPAPVAAAVAAPAPQPEPEEEPVEAAQEAGPGTLTVNTYPWAKVFVDGADLGRTPLVGHSLPAGTHQLELIVPSANDKKITETVTITAGEETKVVKRVPVEEEGEGGE